MSAQPVEGSGAVAVAVDASITRAVRALLGFHGMNANGSALADPLGTSEDTIARRMKHGRWEATEVFALAAFFGVTVGDLYSGAPALGDSALNDGVRLSRQQESAGQEPHSGSDMDLFLDAVEATKVSTAA
jgi:hypothetical protein